MSNYSLEEIRKAIGETCAEVWENLVSQPSLDTIIKDGKKITVLRHKGYLGEIWTEKEGEEINVRAKISFAPDWSDIHVVLRKFVEPVKDESEITEVYKRISVMISEMMLIIEKTNLFHFDSTTIDYKVYRALQTSVGHQLNKTLAVFSGAGTVKNFTPVIISVGDDTVRVITKLPDGTIYDKKINHNNGKCEDFIEKLEAIVSKYDVEYLQAFADSFKLTHLVPVDKTEKSVAWVVDGQNNSKHRVSFSMKETSFRLDYVVAKGDGVELSKTFEESFDPEHPFTIYEAYDELCKSFWSINFRSHLEGRLPFDKLGNTLKTLAGEKNIEVIDNETDFSTLPKWRYKVPRTHVAVFAETSNRPDFCRIYLSDDDNW